MPDARMTSTQFREIRITPRDHSDRVATLDPNVPVQWRNSNAAILQLEPLPNEGTNGETYVCRVSGAGTAGNDDVTFTGDADLGDGMESFVISRSFEVELAHANAEHSTVEISDAQEQQ